MESTSTKDEVPCFCDIIVFGRLPRPGRVKTRLAASIGPEAACAFYKACAEHIILTACLSMTHDKSLDVTVHHSSGDSDVEVRDWLQDFCSGNVAFPPGLCCQSVDPDLGVKMHHAMSRELSKSRGRKAIIIGTDIPDISVVTLVKAARALDYHDVVLGPAEDGGFYLMGLRGQADASLFKGIAWSTESVLTSIMERMQICGLSLAPLETIPRLRDIDVIEDLRHWLLHGEPSASPGSINELNHSAEIADSESFHSRYSSLRELATKLVEEVPNC